MLLELMLQDEYREGKAEGKAEGMLFGKAESVIEFLNENAPVAEDLKEIIMNEKNLDTLNRWLKLAAKATSIEQFIQEM